MFEQQNYNSSFKIIENLWLIVINYNLWLWLTHYIFLKLIDSTDFLLLAQQQVNSSYLQIMKALDLGFKLY